MADLLYCRDAKDLLEALALAIHELVRLHEEQFWAVLDADPESTRFDDLIHIANERKRHAKYAYVHHLETHGCSVADSVVLESLSRAR
jgi:tRNA splicing endonuclease